MRVRRLLLAGLLVPLCSAQQPSQTVPPKPGDAASTQAYAAQREADLAPALRLIQHNDLGAAYAALVPLLDGYPHDLRVLLLTANAARITGDLPKALDLYRQNLLLHTDNPGALHLGLARTYADMHQWAEFNRERSLVRTLALQGDPTLSFDNGYVIEDHRSAGVHIEVLEFPSTDAHAVTRFRFLFLSSRQPGKGFTPSIDLESNPVDAASFQTKYPHQAAAHIRPFALVSYPDAKTRGFLKFYPDGEPPLEDIQADVLANADRFAAAAGPITSEPHRPVYHPAITSK